MKKIWDDSESTSEYDLISEDAEQTEVIAAEYASKPVLIEANEETLEQISEEAAFELTKTESNVIYNARLRLEQAKLYEMLINHNLFDGVDASPEAIKNVQNELKFYIVKRLEILLGLREQTVPKKEVQSVQVELPFNDVEIDFLKQLAYKGTFGKSNDIPVEKKPSQPKPLQQPKPLVSKTIKPIKEVPELQTQKPQPQKAPVQKQPIAPKENKTKIKSSVDKRELTQAEAKQLALEDLKSLPNKPFHEMTAKEKAQRVKEVNEKYKKAKPTNALPMPSDRELEMKYLTQQQMKQSSRAGGLDQFNAMLANALTINKNKGDYDDN